MRPAVKNIRRILAPALCLAMLIPAAAHAYRDTLPFLDYRTDSWFLPQSPAVTGGPAAGLFNPGAAAMIDHGAGDLWWNNRNIRSGLDNYGFAFGRGLNFGMNTSTFGTTADSYKIYDYQLGMAAGSRRHSFGMAYRWSRGETARTPRQQALSLGTVHRVRNWMSFGASGVWSLESSAAQYVFDVGVRPLGRSWLTLFADWTANDDQAFFRDGVWGAGVEVRPIRGLHLGARARERARTGEVDYSVLLGVTWNFLNVNALPLFDENGDEIQSQFLVRTQPPFSGFETGQGLLARGSVYYPLSLENKVLTYQKYRYFDDKRVAWLDLLPLLNRLRDSDDIDGVAVNLAGFRGRPSLIWELRQKLQQIKDSGKNVVIHTDRMDPAVYYLAAVADHLTMDPWGNLGLPGYALSRSYLKGTLAKLGLGFQELRYYEYKSALETYSRDSMSAADRQQRQRIVDVLYETVLEGARESRGITARAFQTAVDEKTILSSAEALELGLVDEIARWDDLGPSLKKQGVRLQPLSPGSDDLHFWDDQWGQPWKIPVVYAVGPCAMDSGINGRRTSEYLRRLARDPDVAAVVLRADSPGGFSLPSDLVAGAVAVLKEAGKPVIVSQGDVAASGGYWISMDGTEILTTPMTITGSIGVIGGWVWDDGFTEKLGVSSDIVQRGKRADLFTAINLPFLGGVPRRPLDPEELERIKELITDNYDQFVSRVAAGRNLSTEAVNAVAQGRVWMGGDAIAHGLVDRFGSLDDAITRARQLAGIEDWRQVEITEYPPRPLIQWPTFGPRLPRFFGLGDALNDWLATLYGLDDQADVAALTGEPLVGAPGLTSYDVEFLKAVSHSPGAPIMMVGPEVLPESWSLTD
jgi:protease-4